MEREELESVYSQLATMKTKYDHLFSVCTSLLKSWPDRDSDGKPIPKEQTTSQEEEQIKDSNPTAELKVVDKEIQLLDAVLLKAEKVRAPPQNKPKYPSHLSERPKPSIQEAVKIYKQPTAKAQKTARRVNSSSKICPRIAANTGQRKKSATYTKRSAGHLPSTAKVTGGIGVPNISKISALSSDKEAKDTHKTVFHSSSPAVNNESEREGDSESKDAVAFDIKQNGTKLSMPAKYYKLQQSLCKLSEQPRPQETSVAGQRFCKRLTSNSELNSLEGIYTTLLAEELSWLKRRLLTLTPQDLTVNERSPWEDVWRIKTTLEALTEHAQKIKAEDHKFSHSPASLREDEQRKSYTAPKTLAYSSLEEWESMATAELQLLLKRYELGLLEFVNQKLLPFLPATNCPTHTLQTIYELAGIPKPIYVKISDSGDDN